jgi:hypothetical protein
MYKPVTGSACAASGKPMTVTASNELRNFIVLSILLSSDHDRRVFLQNHP